MKKLFLFLKLMRPFFLLGGMLLFALGAGIAHHLGEKTDWTIYIWGQLWVTTLQLSTHFLNEYFNSTEDIENRNRTPFSGGSGVFQSGILPKRTALIAGLSCLAGLASFTVILISTQKLDIVIISIMIISFLLAFFYSVPPLRLERTGFGELAASILVSFLLPLFAFLLQTHEFHRLIPMTVFPLFFLHMAMLLAFELPDYGNDIKYNKRTMLVRMGWERGMFIHNLMILSAFIVLAISAIYGLPSFLWIPGFLILPIGMFQIWQFRNISNGSKPNWTLVTSTAIGLFAIMSYFFTFAYWIN
jgi:1,4-dihydroxy-2-naphthoate octaprenyltransferase